MLLTHFLLVIVFVILSVLETSSSFSFFIRNFWWGVDFWHNDLDEKSCQTAGSEKLIVSFRFFFYISHLFPFYISLFFPYIFYIHFSDILIYVIFNFCQSLLQLFKIKYKNFSLIILIIIFIWLLYFVDLNVCISVLSITYVMRYAILQINSSAAAQYQLTVN